MGVVDEAVEQCLCNGRIADEAMPVLDQKLTDNDRRAQAGASLLALLDDIASLLDNITTLTKVATSKTAGVLSDGRARDRRRGLRPQYTYDERTEDVFHVARGLGRIKLSV